MDANQNASFVSPLSIMMSNPPNQDEPNETPVEKLLNEFQSKLQHIENLEERVEQRVRIARRRLMSLQPPNIRQTHLRMFISHSFAPEITNSGAMAALMKGQDTKPSPPIWKLHIEGTLLVDHLDFEAATKFDANAKFKTPADDKSNNDEETLVDAKIRPPVKTSQLFHKITVGFQTIFEPLKPSPLKKKKSRRTSTPKSAPVIEDDPKMPSKKQVISYKCCDQPGADVWSFQYIEPPSPDPTKWKLSYVVATIDLYRRLQYATSMSHKRYRIKSIALQKALFPHHGPMTTDVLTGTKRNVREAMTEIPTHNEVHIPTSLSMEEITNAFYTYICDKKLSSAADPSVVVADTVLQDLLGMEQFPFNQLQQLLFTRYLIEPIAHEDSIRISYIMETSNASVFGEAGGDTLQFDVDSTVPSLFPVRVRELMRRVKKREMEYTAARAKAKYLIPHGRDDSRLKEVIDTAALDVDSVQLHMALAMGAPEQSEAREIAKCDAQLSYLMGQLERRVPEAVQARERYKLLTEAIEGVAKSGH